MTKAADVMDEFMKKLSSNEFERENQPNSGPQMDDEFIREQIDSYSEMLGSGIVKAFLDKEIG